MLKSFQRKGMIFMKEIRSAILDMGGPQSGEGPGLLCVAIEEAQRYLPLMPQMKVIWTAVRRRTGKPTVWAVSKALERAVDDLWREGDREAMAVYRRAWLYDRPTPKEFIAVMAAHLWDGVERPVDPVG